MVGLNTIRTEEKGRSVRLNQTARCIEYQVVHFDHVNNGNICDKKHKRIYLLFTNPFIK